MKVMSNKFRNSVIEHFSSSLRNDRVKYSKLEQFFENEIGSSTYEDVAIYVFSNECKLPFITSVKSSWYKIERMYFLNVLYSNNIEEYINQYPSTIPFISRREFRWWNNIHTFLSNKMTIEEMVNSLLSSGGNVSVYDLKGNKIDFEDKDELREDLIVEFRRLDGEGIIDSALNSK